MFDPPSDRAREGGLEYPYLVIKAKEVKMTEIGPNKGQNRDFQSLFTF